MKSRHSHPSIFKFQKLKVNKIQYFYLVTGFKVKSGFWTFRDPFWLQFCVAGWLVCVTVCVTGSSLGWSFWWQSSLSSESKTSGNDCARCFCCDERRKSRNVVVDFTLPPWVRLLKKIWTFFNIFFWLYSWWTQKMFSSFQTMKLDCLNKLTSHKAMTCLIFCYNNNLLWILIERKASSHQYKFLASRIEMLENGMKC